MHSLIMGDRSALPHRDAHNTRCSETGERKKNTTLYATLENCTTSAERERVCLVLSHVRSRSIPSMRGAVRAAAACSLCNVSGALWREWKLLVIATRHWLANNVPALLLILDQAVNSNVHSYNILIIRSVIKLNYYGLW